MNIFYENLAQVNAPFKDKLKEQFETVLNSGWFILGTQVKAFEQAFAEYIGVKHVIGVASGLDALTLSLLALGLPKGSEVVVAANAYIATIIAIKRAGLQPVLVEPSLDDGNLDVSRIEARLTKQTRAILPLHMYGNPCDMVEIMGLAADYDLKIVEDCAQAHGAKYKNKSVGSFGECGAFSFYPTKNLGGLGDGGAIATNDDVIADHLRALRNYGSHRKYENIVIGYNSRLDELQAAFLSVKLERLNEINQHKQRLAERYQNNLHPQFMRSAVNADKEHVYHIFAIRHPKRDALRAYLLDNGIQTEIHYPIAPYAQKATVGMFEGTYPVSDAWHQSILSLPISYGHTEEEIDYVIQVMNEFTP